jgi:hypothetical protein
MKCLSIWHHQYGYLTKIQIKLFLNAGMQTYVVAVGKRKLNRRSGNPELYTSCGLCNQYENQQQRIRTQKKILHSQATFAGCRYGFSLNCKLATQAIVATYSFKLIQAMLSDTVLWSSI